jgi:murein DD-endopeptidase MepM/ murein hydrolase activator NlpD
MGMEDEPRVSSPEHRPLPRVGIPLLREEVRAARIKRALLVVAVLLPVIGTSVAIGFYAGSRPGAVSSETEGDAGVDADSVFIETTELALPVDAGADASDPSVRIETAAEHVTSDAGTPVTEGATTRRTYSFGAAPAFRNALMGAGMTRDEAMALETALTPVLDFRRCRPEHRLVVERDATGRLVRFEYRTSATDYVAMTRNADGSMRGNRVEVPVERVRLVRAGRVTSSIGEALEGAGLRASLVSAFVEAFQGRVDFTNDTRQGDVFRVIVDEERVHGRFLKYGTVHAVMFDGTATGHIEAYWFQTPGERGQFYDATGRELHGGWLIVPGRFERISSPYDPRRMHPILRRIQPHNGIDFAAPTGTPVWAAAAGTVIWAGPKGPNGNLVGIQHGGGYQTYYAHLSRISPGITRGVHVTQRQSIGQVGTTGRSTGPHLHFGLKRGSSFADPASVLNGPGRQLPGASLRTFQARMRGFQREMLAASVVGGSSAN